MDSSDCKKVPAERIVAREDVLYVIVDLGNTKVTAAEESSILTINDLFGSFIKGKKSISALHICLFSL